VKLCVQDLIDYGVDGSKRTEFEDSLRKQVTEIKKINNLKNGLENKHEKEITNMNIEEKDINKNEKEITKIHIEEKDINKNDNEITKMNIEEKDINKNEKEITKINIEEKDINKNEKEITKMNIEEKDRHAYNVGEENKATPNKKNTRTWDYFRKKKEVVATKDDKASAEAVSKWFGHMKRRSGN
jgi:hypothetical protein